MPSDSEPRSKTNTTLTELDITEPQPTPDLTAPFLDAKALCAKGHFGTIFHNIDLNARHGDLVALSGEAGTGHTALLLALSGRWKLDSGTLTVNGDTKPRRIRDHFTIASAPPAVNSDDYHTVNHVIAEMRAAHGRKIDIDTWMDRLNVNVDASDTYTNLPQLQQTLLLIALGAATETPGVILDNVDHGVTRQHSRRLFTALRTVAEAERLVITGCLRPDPPADITLSLDA